MQEAIRPGKIKPFYHLPPTAVPISSSDVKNAIRALVDPNESRERFIAALTRSTSNPNCLLASSGRSALALILMTLQQRSKRSSVIISAYTCPTVAQAVLSVGLRPVFCDVDPHTLDLDRDSLKSLLDEDVLAIIPTHLYGLVHDISDLVKIGREADIYIIEDAAQAFGASVQGRMVGNAGDFGFFSLGRGKCIPVGHGGVIIAKDDFIPELMQKLSETASKRAKRDVASLVKFLAYGLATTPTGWWFIVHSPLNPAEDGTDIDSLPPIGFEGLSPTQASIGTSILQRMDEIKAVRRGNAQRLKSILANFEFVKVPETPIDSESVYLRFPIILDERTRVDKLYRRLSEAGIGVSRSYVRTLPDMFTTPRTDGPTRFPGADRLATCLLTLPTHAYLDSRAFSRIQNAFELSESI